MEVAMMNVIRFAKLDAKWCETGTDVKWYETNVKWHEMLWNARSRREVTWNDETWNRLHYLCYIFTFRILASAIVFQVLMIGVFSLKRSWYAALMVVPLVLVTLIYWWIMKHRYKPHGDYLALSEAAESKIADQGFLEVNLIATYFYIAIELLMK